MLIMCAGVLIAVGFINISTSKQGKMLTEKTVNYADYIMAKNAAHTAIQMAMQEINKDENNAWVNAHNINEPGWSTWVPQNIERDVELYIDYTPSGNFWDPDDLRLISNAKYKDISVQVISQYLKEPFSSLVPDFVGSIALPTGFNSFNFDGNAHNIKGTAPSGTQCEDKPAIVTNSQETKDKLPGGLNMEGDITVDESLSYEPTDELIERLYNSGNATLVDKNWGDPLGTADNPGVFFIEDGVKLTGQQSEGYGILVIRGGGHMEYEGELEVAGNFEFNGLVIFENAADFDGRGTPTINGSVLVGNTSDYEHGDNSIDISIGGNININYDCRGEDYAKQAAALAVEQYKYTRIVTSEGANYSFNEL